MACRRSAVRDRLAPVSSLTNRERVRALHKRRERIVRSDHESGWGYMVK
jgi:hypothetical protein